MPRGGSRKHPPDCQCGKCPVLGRPRVKAELPEANKRVATQVLALKSRPHPASTDKSDGCRCELCSWFDLLHHVVDMRLRFDARKYLTDKRDGKAVQTINHIHDKPIELNMTVSMSEIVRGVRQRKLEYERSRG